MLPLVLRLVVARRHCIFLLAYRSALYLQLLECLLDRTGFRIINVVAASQASIRGVIAIRFKVRFRTGRDESSLHSQHYDAWGWRTNLMAMSTKHHSFFQQTKAPNLNKRMRAEIIRFVQRRYGSNDPTERT